MSFEFYINSFPLRVVSLLHFTIGENTGTYGDRNPAVFLTPGRKLKICSPINGDADKCYTSDITLDKMRWISLQITQKFHNEQYHYKIKIDNDLKQHTVNDDPNMFTNVSVYASNPWIEPMDGMIRNLRVISPTSKN